jgi:hypothetical protein
MLDPIKPAIPVIKTVDMAPPKENIVKLLQV